MKKKITTTTTGRTLVALALAVAMLVGCSAAGSQPDSAAVTSEQSGEQADTLQALDRSGQLALGTLSLEETEDAVTAEQAAALLPLWQAIRSGALQSEAETHAVLKQIEGAMTSQQLAAVQTMLLTGDDLISWAQSQGVNLEPRQGFPMPGEDGGLPPEVEERLREQFGGQLPNPEEIATLQAQRGKMSDEERPALRARAEAGGREFGGGQGQLAIVLNPLIELLTQRAGA